MKLKLLAGLLSALLLVAGCMPAAEDMTDTAGADVSAEVSDDMTDASGEMTDDMTDASADMTDDMTDAADDMTDEMASPFVTFDGDADGLISEDEYNAGIGNFDTELAFADIDADADGSISEDEFGLFGADFGM